MSQIRTNRSNCYELYIPSIPHRLRSPCHLSHRPGIKPFRRNLPRDMTVMQATAILGIGNILLKDDSIGVHVVRQLQNEHLPPGVDPVDGGTATMDMLSFFIQYPKVIIVDALRTGVEPGTIYKLTPDDLPDYQCRNLSIHDIQILDVVKIAALLGKKPQVTIIGVEPKEICPDLQMSEELVIKVPEIIRIIKKELDLPRSEDVCVSVQAKRITKEG
jgi:hydrogenase maturation protease